MESNIAKNRGNAAATFILVVAIRNECETMVPSPRCTPLLKPLAMQKMPPPGRATPWSIVIGRLVAEA